MTEKQPQVRSTEEALRLADALKAPAIATGALRHEIIAELRRLHTENSALRREVAALSANSFDDYKLNQELLEALEDVMYWDNGKPEWEAARAAIAKATAQTGEPK